jgi:DNA polymerase-3 subunit gamma/tau
MEYTVLARRYRPQAFGEVVGQEHIAQALKNAINSDRVAHAYLFTGARGVGKTSTARILAKSLNCPTAQAGEPCNDCDVCQAISVGSDVDVIEIDGASNRGIEDIRALRANVNVRSMRSRYKIYIIDEVHMLTREAFNALLKTLEEPPPNVKFIFCTTEPQKVPDTILSRCQRFDFGTIAEHSIKTRLNEIAKREGVSVEPDAIDLVARRANGSMRDSQSLFDQLLSFGGQTVAVADVHRLLGTAPDERLQELFSAIIDAQPGTVLVRLSETLSTGVQLGELLDQLIAYARDIMVISSGASGLGLLAVGEPKREMVTEQARRWGLTTTLSALQILSETKAKLRFTTQGRPLVELALVRLAQLRDLEFVGQLVQKLKAGQPLALTVTGGNPLAAAAEPEKKTPVSPVRPEPEPAVSTEYAAGQRVAAPVPVRDLPPTPEDEPAEPASPPTATIRLERGSEQAFWSQVFVKLPDMTKSQVQKSARVAISGPNSLLLTFPKRYHLAKESLERGRDLKTIEEIASTLAGRPIRVQLDVDPTLDAHLPAPQESAASDSDSRVVTSNHPLVEAAIRVLGAKLIRSETISVAVKATAGEAAEVG